jgi:hypothetical protein
MFPGTYFLVKVDEKYRRSYKRTWDQDIKFQGLGDF